MYRPAGHAVWNVCRVLWASLPMCIQMKLSTLFLPSLRCSKELAAIRSATVAGRARMDSTTSSSKSAVAVIGHGVQVVAGNTALVMAIGAGSKPPGALHVDHPRYNGSMEENLYRSEAKATGRDSQVSVPGGGEGQQGGFIAGNGLGKPHLNAIQRSHQQQEQQSSTEDDSHFPLLEK